MWQVITDAIERDIYYNTCIMSGSVSTAEQKMKLSRGLWWTNDSHYVYYTPTHYKID